MGMISTMRGDIDESLLTKRQTLRANGVVTEYLFEGEVVRQDVTISLQGLPSFTQGGSFERYGFRWELPEK